MRSFISTRGQAQPVSAKAAIWQGLAPDGGLYVPESVADLKFDLQEIARQSYQETAAMILGAIFDDFTPAQMQRAIAGAYGASFSAEALTPLSPLGAHHLLELYHGPTSAFKDVALTLLPYLLTAANPQQDAAAGQQTVYILTATSGDTGKAALEGFKDVPGTFITVFYPAGGVSKVQERQMRTAAGKNTQVIAVEGNFDDCQRLAKDCATDARLAALGAGTVQLSSANSINAGRLFPQVVYYFRACAELAARGDLQAGQTIDFVVPTGNFGNILAGYYAKLMGCPIGKLICASNENNVLTEFIETGHYDRRRPLLQTTSPSMDILVSSNLERLLFLLSDADAELIRGYMRDLTEKGEYQISADLLTKVQEHFGATYAPQNASDAAIKHAWQTDHVLIDPHTACAYAAVVNAQQENAVVLSTASAYKFPRAVLSAITGSAPDDDFAALSALEELTGVTIPTPLANLAKAPICHSHEASYAQAKEAVAETVKELAAGRYPVNPLNLDATK